jgi:hypothetical protein
LKSPRYRRNNDCRIAVGELRQSAIGSRVTTDLGRWQKADGRWEGRRQSGDYYGGSKAEGQKGTTTTNGSRAVGSRPVGTAVGRRQSGDDDDGRDGPMRPYRRHNLKASGNSCGHLSHFTHYFLDPWTPATIPSEPGGGHRQRAEGRWEGNWQMAVGLRRRTRQRGGRAIGT